MKEAKIKIEIDTSSLDEALDKVRQLKTELRQLGLPYITGNPVALSQEHDSAMERLAEHS